MAFNHTQLAWDSSFLLSQQAVLLPPSLHYHGFEEAPECSQLWDSVNARVCPEYIPWVAAMPLVVAVCLTVGHALNFVMPYRPEWLQPFVEEIILYEPHKLLHKRYTRFPSALLCLLSACGLFLQAVIVWNSFPQIEKLYPALTWALALLLILVLRPRTAPKSLLLLHSSCAVSQIMILRKTDSRIDSALTISQLAATVVSIIVILWMPLRDPFLPKDDISPAFAPPISDLRSPEDELKLWQFLTVAWMTPLISIGSKRQLNDEDVWFLGYEFQHSHLHERFRELRGSVVRRLLKANFIDLILLTIFGIVDLVAKLSVPVLLQQLLKSMENPLSPRSASILYAILALVVRLVSGQLGVLSLWYGRRCYERSRGEMITMLYEKTLSRKIAGANPNSSSESPTVETTEGQVQQVRSRLRRLGQVLISPFKGKKSSATKEELKEPASMGKILNLMRNDVYEIAQRFWEFQTLITTPIGLIFSVVLIWQLIGWPCLIGTLTVVIGQILNVFFARAMLHYERMRRTSTDKKLQLVSQFVEAIRHLRYYGWQDKWCEQIMEARQRELGIRLITGSWMILITFTNSFASGLFPVAAFYAYSYLAGLPLRIDVAFPALQVFTMLEANMRAIPSLITVLLNARVAVGRIEDFMNEPNKAPSRQGPGPTEHMHANGNSKNRRSPPDEDEDPGDSVSMPRELGLKDASFSWPGHTSTVLHNVTISFPPGLTVICGEVGSGKSALLQAILGELDQKSGEVIRSEEMYGYCAQSPWLQSMSIRENILFSAPYEEERYKKVLDACALITDMANFKHGDLSNIGENGIGLSGGQRARVALARAVYSRADTLLLDDPISALDHQTAEFVIRNCLTGKLVEDRTIILVTHRVDVCKDLAQQVLEVSNGNVRLLDLEAPFSNEVQETISSNSVQEPDEETNEDKTAAAVPEKFMEDEYRAHGGVQAKIYWEYIRAGKLKWWFLLTCALALRRLVNVGRTWFLKEWGEAYNNPTPETIYGGPFDGLPSPETNVRPWLVGFLLIAVTQSTLTLVCQVFLLVIVLTAARKMFRDVMTRVSHATFRFFDVTPIGRLMNRLTSDISTIDGGISAQFMTATQYSIVWVTSLVVIGSVTPVFLAFSLALTIAFVLIFLRFLPTSQSLRRLEMASLSPLMSNFGALLDGLTTVRAFNAQKRFQDRVIAVTDAFQKMDHFYWSLQTWLMFRFDVLSAFSTLILTLIAIYSGISSGLTAFVLIAANNFVTATHTLCRAYGQLQMDFVSVERVVELIHLEQEKPGSIDPPAWWPTLDGDILFENTTIRYAPHLDPSLSELSFLIKGGSTTAIVGRTGSGKSTLAMALLATVLPDSGRILIDNIDITAVDKQALRQRITFVAQDPVLFPGSMRQNLDPMNEYEDEECERVLLKICGRHQWKLETVIEAGGRNLSQGQRQLIGLARTLLRRSPIVILDEATASIDMETANIIQEILHEEMKGRTVITIAHRLEAVKNAEYCIVLGKGHLIKYGRAEDILKENNSNLDSLMEG